MYLLAAMNRGAFAAAGVKPLVDLLHNPAPEVDSNI